MADSLSPSDHTAIGAVAGSMEVLLMQPTIAIKNALQEGRPVPWSPKLLYRGLGVNLGSIAPITAIQFGVHRILEAAQGEEVSQLGQIGAATGAGAASSLVGCPAELLMIQQQKHGRPLMQEAQRIVAKYGPTGLYRGLTGTAIRETIYTGSYLGLCPVLQTYIDRTAFAREGPPGASLVVSGISTGLLASVVTQPIDTAKTRMQAFMDPKEHPEYATLRSTLQHLVKTQGLSGLWAGIVPRAGRISCAVIILQGVRSKLISLVEQLKGAT
ncbi:g8081 [Coccomyxa viridis]|uniref:G8081 protein n=1 Tax=Coccomyxa viridis TaxID=1274662 RepID=A0ABP1G4B8_9CHLO